jgi:GGDEF domain-containing protein
VGAAIYKIRTAFLRRHEHELEQQVADRTAELEGSRRHLEQLAYFDILTALPNRRLFAENFRRLLALTPGRQLRADPHRLGPIQAD